MPAAGNRQANTMCRPGSFVLDRDSDMHYNLMLIARLDCYCRASILKRDQHPSSRAAIYYYLSELVNWAHFQKQDTAYLMPVLENYGRASPAKWHKLYVPDSMQSSTHDSDNGSFRQSASFRQNVCARTDSYPLSIKTGASALQCV